jgi:16S rRNA (adenine1518-N6/adenine1519-N6)-dimethyltransferase
VTGETADGAGGGDDAAPAAAPAPAIPRGRKEIRHALRDLGIRPSRRLGQNFLADPGLAARITEATGAGPGDLVLEVGPGLGALTGPLAATGASVLAVEVDGRLAGFLRAAFAEVPRVEVLEADALDGRGGPSEAMRRRLGELRPAPPGRWIVGANLPYAAATPLVLALLEEDPPPACLVVMVQREVGDRLRAAPGTEAYGPLSVLVQRAAQVKGVVTAKQGAFEPMPDVESSVVRLVPDPALRGDPGHRDRLRRVVHAAFGLRRKTLSNALGRAGLGTAAEIEALGLDPRLRAEALPPAAFALLADRLPALAAEAPPRETPPA